ncbi:MAG: hypothetical protein Q8R18_03365 [bacterium]|nr:hypothetical protein [bacterium]
MYPFRDAILETINEQKSGILFGLATIGISAALGAYLFPREVSNIGIYDKDLDGYVDVIEDKNWKIILTNDSKNLIQEENRDFLYITCYYSETISMKNIGTEFAQRVRPYLEDCLKKY